MNDTLTPTILAETDDYIILNKPAGLVVHSDGRTKEKTVCDFLVEHYPQIRGIGEPIELSDGTQIDRPGIVHRLDRETSGVLLVAKNQRAYTFFKKQFQNRTIKKVYHALVYGHFREARGRINSPIGRSKSDFRRFATGRGARGEMRESVTTYVVKDTWGSGEDTISFVEARPETGRTHQIRVHMQSINHSVVCDSLYAPNKKCLADFGRLALHARAIFFKDLNGEEQECEAPYPKDFQRVIDGLEK